MSQNNKTALIIGIGGASRSGKTTLAKVIKNIYKERKVLIICQDDYVFPDSEIPKINGKTDWEHPRSINFRAIINKIKATKEEYDIIIVEGIFAFYNKLLNRFYEKSFFMYLERRIFFQRKENDHRWGKVADWYIKHIWDAYLKYGKKNIPTEDIMILDGTKPVKEKDITDFIESKPVEELLFDLFL